MQNILLVPPIAFLIVLAASTGLVYLFSAFSLKPKKGDESSSESYACGECDYDSMAQPDYSFFFPFAFFFTIAHVAVLVITTVPGIIDTNILVTALLYMAAAIVGLYILFRR